MFLSVLRDMWAEVEKNPDASLWGFSLNYVCGNLFGVIFMMAVPAVILVLKGRSFERYYISALLIGSFWMYLIFIGTTSL